MSFLLRIFRNQCIQCYFILSIWRTAESNGKLLPLFIPGKTATLVPEFAMGDLSLGRTVALVPGFAVKDLPLGRTLMIMVMIWRTMQNFTTHIYFLKSLHFYVLRVSPHFSGYPLFPFSIYACHFSPLPPAPAHPSSAIFHGVLGRPRFLLPDGDHCSSIFGHLFSH